jgi:DNA-binding protein H-NS
MNINLAKRSMDELHQLESEVKRELQRRDLQRITEARNQVFAIAKGLGMDVRDLLGKHSQDKRQSKPVEVKYRNPANAQQEWTGRGRRPQWVSAWLGDGKSLEDLSL